MIERKGVRDGTKYPGILALRALGMPRFSNPLAMLKEEKSSRIQPLIREE